MFHSSHTDHSNAFKPQQPNNPSQHCFFLFLRVLQKKPPIKYLKKRAKEMNEKRGDLGEGEEDKQAMKAI